MPYWHINCFAIQQTHSKFNCFSLSLSLVQRKKKNCSRMRCINSGIRNECAPRQPMGSRWIKLNCSGYWWCNNFTYPRFITLYNYNAAIMHRIPEHSKWKKKNSIWKKKLERAWNKVVDQMNTGLHSHYEWFVIKWRDSRKRNEVLWPFKKEKQQQQIEKYKTKR